MILEVSVLMGSTCEVTQLGQQLVAERDVRQGSTQIITLDEQC